jgi:hypothetical protein
VEVHRVLHSLGSYSQDKLRVEQDGRFTQAGRDAELLERKKMPIVNTADASQRIINYGNSLLEREAAIFAVPPLSPHDSVGALLDREARDYVRSLSGPDRAAMLQQLSRGEAERMTLALLRSPVPLGNEERVAQQAWRTAVESANPDAVEQLAAETEQLRWAQLLMQRAAAKLKEKIGMSGYELYATAAMFTPAMPDGPAIFGFRPDEMRTYRARWNALKAKAA